MTAENLPGADTIIEGVCNPGFEPVVAAFGAGLKKSNSVGAALSVWHHGREVVNVWAGVADHRTGRHWAATTTNVLFSCSKGLAAVALARLAQTGRVDLEMPLADLWPEFGACGKQKVSIADVMAHRGGVSAPRTDLTIDDILDYRRWAAMIAEQQPLWEPGAAHSYHALTVGPLLQEIVRRVTGRELHDVLVTEVAEPLRADMSFRPTPDDLDRVTRLVTDHEWDTATSAGTAVDDLWIARGSTLGGAFPRGLVRGDTGFNDHRVLQAGLAGAGAVGTASALAKIWSATVATTDGVRLLNGETTRYLQRPRSEGPWRFDPGPPYQRWGVGVQLASDMTPWWGPTSFGHDGAGGQSGFADPVAKIGLGYLTNHMSKRDRVQPIIAALRQTPAGPAN